MALGMWYDATITGHDGRDMFVSYVQSGFLVRVTELGVLLLYTRRCKSPLVR